MPTQTEAFAKSFEKLTLAELKSKVSEWVPGSPQHSGILLAIQWKEEAAQKADEERAREIRLQESERADRHHAERQRATWVAVCVSVLSALVALASFLAGMFLPSRQMSELDLRVKRLEQRPFDPSVSTNVVQPQPKAP